MMVMEKTWQFKTFQEIRTYDYWSEYIEVASCPCEQWQWNGAYSMEETHRRSQHIDGEDCDLFTYTHIVGEMKNGLRHGTFYEDSSIYYISAGGRGRLDN